MDRFWNKANKHPQECCWPWMASKNKDGYGWFKFEGKMQKAHRVAYMLFTGKRDLEGKEVCHSCDNPSCVNPRHLFLATHKENIEDRDRKGRGYDRSGENHPRAKLTELEVVDIRYHRDAGLSLKELSEAFGVSKQTISHACNRDTWRKTA